MFGLALRFGISPWAIETANPSVHPNYMGVGTVLTIPLTPTPPTPTATAAPGSSQAAADFSISAPSCYPDVRGGMWCLALAHNHGVSTLESISAVFRLSPGPQASALEQTVYAPLDVLAGGATLPLTAYFDPPIPVRAAAEAQPAGSLPLAKGDPRYTAVTVQAVKTQIDGNTAAVSGALVPTDSGGTAKSVWVLAVAYDKAGQPVGLRKWESPPGGPSLSKASPLSFNLNVYSLGPAIDHVDVLAEGHNN
jgi:hypothetical protein